ncbi:MobC family plasmid mobilization relaxosome protein [Hymenobacter coccineus]|uniref:MobC family plasmid mobilization relaxosome protein n=1 Tax=Hymenobacter coccineus TaxID=1908235 RepID=UPI0009F61015|nr:MobC family plasmid mobilization relaxosome protein [Hymenobacter coccineus]
MFLRQGARQVLLAQNVSLFAPVGRKKNRLTPPPMPTPAATVNEQPKPKRTGKSAGGRPRKAPEEKLKSVTTHVSAARYAELEAGAAEVRQPMSQYVRPLIEAGVGRRKRPLMQLSVEQDGYLRQLAGLANNLNQLAKKAHQNGFEVVANEVAQQAVGVSRLLDYFGQAV